MSKSFSLNSAGYIFVASTIIRHANGGKHLDLYIDGVKKRSAYVYTSPTTWKNGDVYWAGAVGQGTHTVEVKNREAGRIWGCTSNWGSLEIMKFDGTQGIKAVGVDDSRVGQNSQCPQNGAVAAANSALVSYNFTFADHGYAFVTSSFLRLAQGRADLHVYVDGVKKREAATYSSSSRWEEGNIMWAGALANGSHTIEIRAPHNGVTTGIWGCIESGKNWGSMDVLTMEMGNSSTVLAETYENMTKMFKQTGIANNDAVPIDGDDMLRSQEEETLEPVITDQ